MYAAVFSHFSKLYMGRIFKKKPALKRQLTFWRVAYYALFRQSLPTTFAL